MIYERIQDALVVTPNHPEPGIMFYDMSQLLMDTELREKAWDLLADLIRPHDINVLAAIDSRGYLIATSLASKLRLDCSVMMVAKGGKLAGDVHQVKYQTEYTKSTSKVLQIQCHLLKPTDRVAIIDDLAATGGSLRATIQLIQTTGATAVCAGVVVEFTDYRCRELLQLSGVALCSLLKLHSATPKTSQLGWAHHKRTSTNHLTLPQQELIRSKPNFQDQRIVLLYYPPMVALVNSLCLHWPNQFRAVDISWGRFPDGSPNTDFWSDAYLVNKDVLYLGTLEDLSTFVEQMALCIALPRQGIRSLTLCFPYLNTATMDIVSREGIIATVEPLAKLMSSSLDGTQRGPPALQIFDIHALPSRFNFSGQVQLRMMSAVRLLRQRLDRYGNQVILCFPDLGASKRFHFLVENTSTVAFTKERRGDHRILTLAEGHEHLTTEVVSTLQEVVIMDDLVMSGGTLDACHRKLVRLAPGLKGKVSAFVTHPVFPNNGWLKFTPGHVYSGLKHFYVGNTVTLSTSRLRHRAPFQVLDIAPLIVDEIRSRVKPDIVVARPSLSVYVSSANKDKIAAVTIALGRVLPGLTDVQIRGVDSPSNVAEQPVGRETYVGATNRLRHLIDTINDDKGMYVSIESGRFNHNVGHADAAVCMVQYGFGNVEHTFLSPMVPVPAEIVHAAEEAGETMGEALVRLKGVPSKSNWHALYDVEGRDRIELMALGVARGMAAALSDGVVRDNDPCVSS
jgi:adenine phosphoribosyltransferase